MPTTSMPGSFERPRAIASRISSESSTISTRMALTGMALLLSEHRGHDVLEPALRAVDGFGLADDKIPAGLQRVARPQSPC